MGATCCSRMSLEKAVDHQNETNLEKFSYINKCMSPSMVEDKLSPSEQYDCDVDTFFDVDITDSCTTRSPDELDTLSLNTTCTLRCRQYLITEEHLLRKQQKQDQASLTRSMITRSSLSRSMITRSSFIEGSITSTDAEFGDIVLNCDNPSSDRDQSDTHTTVLQAPPIFLGVSTNSDTRVNQTSEFKFSCTDDIVCSPNSAITISTGEQAGEEPPIFNTSNTSVTMEKQVNTTTTTTIFSKPVAHISPQRLLPSADHTKEELSRTSPVTLNSNAANDSGICMATPTFDRQLYDDDEDDDDIDPTDIILQLVAEQNAKQNTLEDNEEDCLLNELWTEVEMHEANIVSRIAMETGKSNSVVMDTQLNLISEELDEICHCRLRMKNLVENCESQVDEDATHLLNKSTSIILLNSNNKLKDIQLHLVLNDHLQSWSAIYDDDKSKENNIEVFTNIIEKNIENLTNMDVSNGQKVNLSEASALIHKHILTTNRLKESRANTHSKLNGILHERLHNTNNNMQEHKADEKSDLEMKKQLIAKLSEICGELNIVKLNHIIEMYKNELNRSDKKTQVNAEDVTVLLANEKQIKEKLRLMKAQERSRLNDKLAAKLASRK